MREDRGFHSMKLEAEGVVADCEIASQWQLENIVWAVVSHLANLDFLSIAVDKVELIQNLNKSFRLIIFNALWFEIIKFIRRFELAKWRWENSFDAQRIKFELAVGFSLLIVDQVLRAVVEKGTWGMLNFKWGGNQKFKVVQNFRL